jgi:DEAD/DEAH box helicase domain-containing protein
MAKNIVYFDLETQQSADEVGGWNRINRMGMSVGVTYSTARGDYRIYGEPQVNDLIRELQRADLVVGFNIVRSATFGVEKTAEGMQAIRWFKEGKLLEIAEYCCYDVKLTKLVHEYGVKHRQLYYNNRFGKKLIVPVDWAV